MQRKQQLLPVDHPHSHCDLLLLRWFLGRKQLLLQQQLRVRLQRQLQHLLLRQETVKTGRPRPVFPHLRRDRPQTSFRASSQISRWISSAGRMRPSRSQWITVQPRVLAMARAFSRQARRYASSCSWMSAWVPVFCCL